MKYNIFKQNAIFNNKADYFIYQQKALFEIYMKTNFNLTEVEKITGISKYYLKKEIKGYKNYLLLNNI